MHHFTSAQSLGTFAIYNPLQSLVFVMFYNHCWFDVSLTNHLNNKEIFISYPLSLSKLKNGIMTPDYTDIPHPIKTCFNDIDWLFPRHCVELFICNWDFKSIDKELLPIVNNWYNIQDKIDQLLSIDETSNTNASSNVENNTTDNNNNTNNSASRQLSEIVVSTQIVDNNANKIPSPMADSTVIIDLQSNNNDNSNSINKCIQQSSRIINSAIVSDDDTEPINDANNIIVNNNETLETIDSSMNSNAIESMSNLNNIESTSINESLEIIYSPMRSNQNGTINKSTNEFVNNNVSLPIHHDSSMILAENESNNKSSNNNDSLDIIDSPMRLDQRVAMISSNHQSRNNNESSQVMFVCIFFIIVCVFYLLFVLLLTFQIVVYLFVCIVYLRMNTI